MIILLQYQNVNNFLQLCHFANNFKIINGRNQLIQIAYQYISSCWNVTLNFQNKNLMKYWNKVFNQRYLTLEKTQQC